MSNLSKEILDAFLPEKEIIAINELVSGHINDTYLVKPREGQQYIIQRINNTVFKDIPGLIRNKTQVSR